MTPKTPFEKMRDNRRKLQQAKLRGELANCRPGPVIAGMRPQDFWPDRQSQQNLIPVIDKLADQVMGWNGQFFNPSYFGDAGGGT